MASSLDPYTKDEFELQRLQAIERIHDPSTLTIFQRLGITKGWRCLDVGAGAGSIARAMHHLSGHVVAVDTDVRFLKPLASETFTILQQDVRDLPFNGEFDLVHARYLLDLLTDPADAVDRLITATRIGGWVVLEEFDDVSTTVVSSTNPDCALRHQKIVAAKQQVWRQRGLDNELGRSLPMYLAERGLEQITAEGRLFLHQGATNGLTKEFRVDPDASNIHRQIGRNRHPNCHTASSLGANLDSNCSFFLLNAREILASIVAWVDKLPTTLSTVLREKKAKFCQIALPRLEPP